MLVLSFVEKKVWFSYILVFQHAIFAILSYLILSTSWVVIWIKRHAVLIVVNSHENDFTMYTIRQISIKVNIQCTFSIKTWFLFNTLYIMYMYHKSDWIDLYHLNLDNLLKVLHVHCSLISLLCLSSLFSLLNNAHLYPYGIEGLYINKKKKFTIIKKNNEQNIIMIIYICIYHAVVEWKEKFNLIKPSF